MQQLGRHRVIMDRQANEPYLERYYVFLKNRTQFPFNVFIHKFLKSDPDDVHDHPWPYATLILKGGYYEWIPDFDRDGKKIAEFRHWRGPGLLWDRNLKVKYRTFNPTKKGQYLPVSPF